MLTTSLKKEGTTVQAADDVKDGAEKLSGVIPALYYDIIARIIPGAAVIAAAFYRTFDWSKPDVMTLIVWLAAGYLVALLLTSLALPLDLLWMTGAYCFERQKKPGMKFWGSTYSPYNVPSNIDEISREHPAVATALAKMVAESTACANLLTGYVVLWVMAHWYPQQPTLLTDVLNIKGTRLLVFVVLIVAWVYRSVGVSVRTFNWQKTR